MDHRHVFSLSERFHNVWVPSLVCLVMFLAWSVFLHVAVPCRHRCSNGDVLNTKRLYKFQPLSGPRSIRLIRSESFLSDANGRTHTLFHLEEFQIDKTPPFEALSYRWDTVGQQDTILLGDERELQISASLKKTLVHLLRTRPMESYYWIDAICINQEDLDERSIQVSLMPEIYSTATATVVWLGEAFKTYDIAAQICVGVEAGSFSINFVDTDTLRATDNPLRADSELPNHWLHEIYNLGTILESLLSRPWFSRVWVIQEIALARAVTVEWSNGSLPWETLVKATRMQADAQGDVRRPVYDRPLKLMEARDLVKSQSLDFTRVVYLSRTFDTTDARDRVYGLLGLNTEFATAIGRPDYSKSIEEVFTDATRTFLSKLSVRALYLMSSEIAHDKIPMEIPPGDSRPTWLADMDRVIMKRETEHRSAVPHKSSWVANLENPPLAWPMDNRVVDKAYGVPEFSVQGTCLNIKGAIVDTIEAVSGWTKSSGNNRQMWLTWHQWFQESGLSNEENLTIRSVQARQIREDGDSQALVVWRTMACDLENRIEDGEALFSWHDWFVNELGMNLLLWDSRLMYDRDTGSRTIGGFKMSTAGLRNTTRHKILFSTETGSKFGLGPRGVKSGDAIAFFAGYNVPFLLRPIAPRRIVGEFAPILGPRRYELLGPCFVHGLMNGEQCDWGKLKWENVLLV